MLDPLLSKSLIPLSAFWSEVLCCSAWSIMMDVSPLFWKDKISQESSSLSLCSMYVNCCRYEHHQQVVLKSHHSFRSTKLRSHTIITQNSVTFQLLKQELTVTFLTCLMSLKNYRKHQASFVQWLNSLIKEQHPRIVCIFPGRGSIWCSSFCSRV